MIGLSHSADILFTGTDMANLSNEERPDMIELLLAKGADVNLYSKEHCTPLMYAAGKGATKTTKVMSSQRAWN